MNSENFSSLDEILLLRSEEIKMLKFTQLRDDWEIIGIIDQPITRLDYTKPCIKRACIEGFPVNIELTYTTESTR
jgi:hypothetical protein